MSDDKLNQTGLSRRSFLGTAAVSGAGIAGAGLLGLAGCSNKSEGGAASGTAGSSAAADHSDYVGPGELDQYYAFNSGGQSGEVRVLGVPSMRELMRIPVFNMDSATGWGRSNESLNILNGNITPETRKFLQDNHMRCMPNGDLHHPHMSFTDQTYDGRYVYVQDKANNRVARIRCDVMKTDKVVEIPNVSGVHGLRPQRYPKTGYVFANGEHIIPITKTDSQTDPKDWWAIYTAVDGETMEIAWQVQVDGNLDNGDADYQGKYSFSTCYNSERALDVQGASGNEQDWVVVFNIAAIEEGIKKGDFKEINGVKVVDGRAVRRIENVSLLRQLQFAEDAGPMAHPVRPASYEEMNNFYTMTVYEKGAEVVRLYHTLLGEAGFQKGMQLYFKRHDGQAVTCDDFRAAMADANDTDLSQMALWYSQAGTPVLDIEGRLNAADNTFTLNIKQTIPATPDMAAKQPMLIPVKIGLLNRQGEAVAFRPSEHAEPQTEAVLLLTEAQQDFVLHGVNEQVVPSLLRGFSAPVYLNYPYSDEDLQLLLAHDSDPFARWEAGQALYRRAVAANLAAIEAGEPLPDHNGLIDAFKHMLKQELDPAFKAMLLRAPSAAELWEGADNIHPLHYHQAREALLDAIAKACLESLVYIRTWALDQEAAGGIEAPYEYHPELAGVRSLLAAVRLYTIREERHGMMAIAAYSGEQAAAHQKTVCARLQDYITRYEQLTPNMTHEMSILNTVNHLNEDGRNQLLQRFAERYADDALVMDKYFILIGASHRPDTLQQVQTALHHPKFSLENPNKARSLLGSFTRNVPHFHAENGSGYAFIADKVMQIDAFNPQVAARLVQAFNICRKLEPQRRALMTMQLERIRGMDKLSKDVAEIVGKILA